MKALQERTFKIVGEMLATMVAQGGPLPQLFNKTTAGYLISCSLDIAADVADISDEPMRNSLQKVTFMRLSNDI